MIVVAYAVGSISTAILVSKLARLPDPRTEGSRNPGATNMIRVGGRLWAAVTLIGDVLKGLLPVLAARTLGIDETGLALVGLAAFMGHLWPVFFGFRGGKGVATALGVLIALSWPTAAAASATWLCVAALFRFSSVSALAAAFLAPFFYWWFELPPAGALGTIIAMNLLLILRHHSNIAKLARGEESRFGEG